MNKLEVSYLGHIYPIEVIESSEIKKANLSFKDGHFIYSSIVFNNSELTKLLKRYFSRELKSIVSKYIKKYSKILKINVKEPLIESSFNKWGSCDSFGQLRFNWKLSLLDESLIEYVVVHELCHLVHLNHDRSFWRLVGKLLPDYKTSEEALEKIHLL